jgi:Flp pilus assembly pilin Flp
MRTKFFRDETGVTPMVEYIITFIIASILFMLMLAIASTIFIDGPQRTVSRIQFTDIGNDLTTKIVDTYLVYPQSGEISTTFDMPMTVAGKDYWVDINRSINNPEDKEIIVYSPYNDVSIYVTLNGVNSTVPVNGSTSSLSDTHVIYYHK